MNKNIIESSKIRFSPTYLLQGFFETELGFRRKP